MADSRVDVMRISNHIEDIGCFHGLRHNYVRIKSLGGLSGEGCQVGGASAAHQRLREQVKGGKLSTRVVGPCLLVGGARGGGCAPGGEETA